MYHVMLLLLSIFDGALFSHDTDSAIQWMNRGAQHLRFDTIRRLPQQLGPTRYRIAQVPVQGEYDNATVQLSAGGERVQLDSTVQDYAASVWASQLRVACTTLGDDTCIVLRSQYRGATGHMSSFNAYCIIDVIDGKIAGTVHAVSLWCEDSVGSVHAFADNGSLTFHLYQVGSNGELEQLAYTFSRPRQAGEERREITEKRITLPCIIDSW